MLGDMQIYEGEEGVVISETTGNQVIIMKNGKMVLRETNRKFRVLYDPVVEMDFPLTLPITPVEPVPELTNEEKAELKVRRDKMKRAIRETNKKE
jgi:hypothetical protein